MRKKGQSGNGRSLEAQAARFARIYGICLKSQSAIQSISISVCVCVCVN